MPHRVIEHLWYGSDATNHPAFTYMQKFGVLCLMAVLMGIFLLVAYLLVDVARLFPRFAKIVLVVILTIAVTALVF